MKTRLHSLFTLDRIHFSVFSDKSVLCWEQTDFSFNGPERGRAEVCLVFWQIQATIVWGWLCSWRRYSLNLLLWQLYFFKCWWFYKTPPPFTLTPPAPLHILTGTSIMRDIFIIILFILFFISTPHLCLLTILFPFQMFFFCTFYSK